MAMRTGKLLWGAAVKSRDDYYRRYLDDRQYYPGFRPIERLSNVSSSDHPTIYIL
jgi:protein-serine/threonine kinase